MAVSLVSISAQLLGSSCTVIVPAAQCASVVDQQGLGFMKGLPPLGRRAGLSCCSRFSGAAVVFATKLKRRSAVLDMDTEDEDEDDEEDGEATEFADMEEWMKNRPPGFGQKEYDTSLEDRLLAEMEAEEKALVALVSKKKAKKSAKATEKQDAPPQGVEVYVGNLPRKRNVDRDLRAAFRSAQGLLHIRPIVEGNEKTREPMCKGLAFLTFASDMEAKDFIQRYNGEDVKFGKTGKKLVCELAAVNSPFKKQVSQKQGTDSPRLQVRDTTRSSPFARASPSSDMAVDKNDSVAVESNLSDRPSTLNLDKLERQNQDIDSLEVSEDERLALEQTIWADLEDEDDFELDRELEADDEEEDLTASPNVENVRVLHARNGLDRQELGRIDIHASDHIDVRQTENDFVVDDEVEQTDKDKAVSIRGRGFGSTSNSIAAGEKDKRIQELESKLKELQVQLEKRQTKAKDTEHAPKSDEKIEALERRLLARATKMEKDSITAKKVTGSKKQSSKVKSVSKGNPSRPKLGGANRLKNKEKQLYTGVLSKYSPLAKEMAV